MCAQSPGSISADPLADRVQKLKDARAEAAKEIEEYKKAKEQEFQAFEASVGDLDWT